MWSKFPYHKQAIIDQNRKDTVTNILNRVPSGATWVPYDKSPPAKKYQTAHYGPKSDVLILRLVDETDTYTKTTQRNILEMFSALSRHLLVLFVLYKDF
jgi:hypothetical protein